MMTKLEAWTWVAENRAFLVTSIRRHKTALVFDCDDDALQEASLRVAEMMERFYDASRGKATTFADRVVSQIRFEVQRQRACKKRGGNVTTAVVCPVVMSEETTSRASPVHDDLAAREECHAVLMQHETGRKVSYQRRFDTLYAKLVADESWPRVARSNGYRSAKGAERAVSKLLTTLRRRNENENRNR